MHPNNSKLLLFRPHFFLGSAADGWNNTHSHGSERESEKVGKGGEWKKKMWGNLSLALTQDTEKEKKWKHDEGASRRSNIQMWKIGGNACAMGK